MTLTAKQRAEKSASAMWSSDQASQWLGMTLDAVDEGTATLSLKVNAHHTNGHGICHGGFIFTLADSAFAFACNSRNQATVAQHNSITFIAPGMLDDKLTAIAREVSLSGRSGIYDVSVSNQKGVLIAEFRGCSRTVAGTLFEE